MRVQGREEDKEGEVGCQDHLRRLDEDGRHVRRRCERGKSSDAAAREHHGARARLNFPKVGELRGTTSQSSSYRGVSWNKHAKKYQVKFYHAGKKKSLGYFVDEEEAARAYDAKASAVLGDKAKLNF